MRTHPSYDLTPLSFARTRRAGYRNLILTMSIAGLWHGGDSWNYLIWGFAHGVALCCARAWSGSGFRLPGAASRLLTLLFVMLAWTLFRAHDIDGAARMYAGQFGLHGFSLGDALKVEMRLPHLLAFALGIASIAWPVYGARLADRPGSRWASAISLWPVPAFFLSFALISSRGAVPFLYFQF